LRAAFCHSCGQKDDDYRRPLLTLTNEFFGDVFQWDSRVLRSIIPFLLIPGTLTRAYMRGQRQKFVSPLRLYLVVSIVFFIALGASDRAIFGFTLTEGRNLAEDFPGLTEELANVDPQYLVWAQNVVPGMFVASGEQADLPGVPVEPVAEFFEGTLVSEYIVPLLIGFNTAIDDPQIYNRVLNDLVPWMLVVLVPVFALILGAVYVRRPVWFIDHLVFSLHYHSFLFAVLLLMLGIAVVTGEPLRGGTAAGFFFLLMGAYLYVAMLRTYRNGPIKTAIKFVILGGVYLNIFLVSLLLASAWGLSHL
jgi:hypothetical protein